MFLSLFLRVLSGYFSFSFFFLRFASENFLDIIGSVPQITLRFGINSVGFRMLALK